MMNCTATVSQKGSDFKKNAREHLHQADKGAKKKVIVQKAVCVMELIFICMYLFFYFKHP